MHQLSWLHENIHDKPPLRGEEIILITSFELSPFVGLLRDADLEYLLLFIIFGCAGSSLLCRLFSSCCEHRLLTVASPYRAQALGVDSAAVAHRLSCSLGCGIFLDQGSNPRLLALAGGFCTTDPPGEPPEVSAFKLQCIGGTRIYSQQHTAVHEIPLEGLFSWCMTVHKEGSWVSGQKWERLFFWIYSHISGWSHQTPHTN